MSRKDLWSTLAGDKCVNMLQCEIVYFEYFKLLEFVYYDLELLL